MPVKLDYSAALAACTVDCSIKMPMCRTWKVSCMIIRNIDFQKLASLSYLVTDLGFRTVFRSICLGGLFELVTASWRPTIFNLHCLRASFHESELTYLNRPLSHSVLWHCWFGCMACKNVPEMTYYVSNETRNFAHSLSIATATPLKSRHMKLFAYLLKPVLFICEFVCKRLRYICRRSFV